MYSAEAVSALLNEMAFLLELSGENVFKVKAYQNAAQIVLEGAGNFPLFIKLAREGQVKGVGSQLSEKIATLYQRGVLPELEELRARFPESLKEMSRIAGLGPKKIKVLFEELGVCNIEQLEQACLSEKVAGLKGFGRKTQEKILSGIEQLKAFSGQFLLSTALDKAEDLSSFLKAEGGVRKIEIAGSIRRHNEIVRNVNLLALAADGAGALQALAQHREVKQVLRREEEYLLVLLTNKLPVELWLTGDESEFSAMQRYLTGSREHNLALKKVAEEKGYDLTEKALLKDGRKIKLTSEGVIFEELGLRYIPPELREDRGEIQKARLVADDTFDLITLKDLKGLLHVHTTYSDGRNTLRQMALAAKERGYEYLGVSDHSKSAAYAGGLSIEAVKEQHAEIEALNKELKPFRIFKGIETDILADGSLDYPPEVLKSFDFVIASVHSYMNMAEEEMTGRILRAIQGPYTTILGHPSGRLLLERAAYPVDIEALLAASAKYQVMMELNSNPHRLDLDWRHLRRAKELGVKIAIGPDAHSVEGLDDICYGVGIARKGGLNKDDVVNCLPCGAFEKLICLRKKAGE